eukprot:5134091-Pyramimonas_sp.AAC.1
MLKDNSISGRAKHRVPLLAADASLPPPREALHPEVAADASQPVVRTPLILHDLLLHRRTLLLHDHLPHRSGLSADVANLCELVQTMVKAVGVLAQLLPHYYPPMLSPYLPSVVGFCEGADLAKVATFIAQLPGQHLSGDVNGALHGSGIPQCAADRGGDACLPVCADPFDWNIDNEFELR